MSTSVPSGNVRLWLCPCLFTRKQVQGQSPTCMVALGMSRFRCVSGPRGSGCREGSSPYKGYSNHGANNYGLVMKLNASGRLAK